MGLSVGLLGESLRGCSFHEAALGHCAKQHGVVRFEVASTAKPGSKRAGV